MIVFILEFGCSEPAIHKMRSRFTSVLVMENLGPYLITNQIFVDPNVGSSFYLGQDIRTGISVLLVRPSDSVSGVEFESGLRQSDLLEDTRIFEIPPGARTFAETATLEHSDTDSTLMSKAFVRTVLALNADTRESIRLEPELLFSRGEKVWMLQDASGRSEAAQRADMVKALKFLNTEEFPLEEEIQRFIDGEAGWDQLEGILFPTPAPVEDSGIGGFSEEEEGAPDGERESEPQPEDIQPEEMVAESLVDEVDSTVESGPLEGALDETLAAPQVQAELELQPEFREFVAEEVEESQETEMSGHSEADLGEVEASEQEESTQDEADDIPVMERVQPSLFPQVVESEKLNRSGKKGKLQKDNTKTLKVLPVEEEEPLEQPLVQVRRIKIEEKINPSFDVIEPEYTSGIRVPKWLIGLLLMGLLVAGFFLLKPRVDTPRPATVNSVTFSVNPVGATGTVEIVEKPSNSKMEINSVVGTIPGVVVFDVEGIYKIRIKGEKWTPVEQPIQVPNPRGVVINSK